jgi:type I restriction enzyme R subunit
MAGLPNATFLGFTGTPVDKTAYGKGTFKTFGCEDDQGYLHKYSIADSIEDGTTLPLYYQLAPNEMLVPHETLDKEFLSLAEAEGVADIEELNKILERAVNLKNFLKGKERIQKVAQFVAEHYRENVEPLGYKAFLVGVDREACAHYKHALDQFLPPEYSEVVYTGSNNDSALLKEFHLDPKRERQIRKSFGKLDQMPKILIVTEKLLTGFDAPVLYAMYLDKPMRDHTLLQAIARVNRPYENEAQEMVKPHGFVLDFVGIFDKLEKALAFDSDEINAIVKDLKLLKVLFKNKMEQQGAGVPRADRAELQRQGRRHAHRALPRPRAAQGVLQGVQGDRDALRDHLARCVPAPVHRRLRHAVGIYQVVRKAYTRSRDGRPRVPGQDQPSGAAAGRQHMASNLGEYVVAIDGSTIELIKNKRRRRWHQGHQPDQEHSRNWPRKTATTPS